MNTNTPLTVNGTQRAGFKFIGKTSFRCHTFSILNAIRKRSINARHDRFFFFFFPFLKSKKHGYNIIQVKRELNEMPMC